MFELFRIHPLARNVAVALSPIYVMGMYIFHLSQSNTKAFQANYQNMQNRRPFTQEESNIADPFLDSPYVNELAQRSVFSAEQEAMIIMLGVVMMYAAAIVASRMHDHNFINLNPGPVAAA